MQYQDFHLPDSIDNIDNLHKFYFECAKLNKANSIDSLISFQQWFDDLLDEFGINNNSSEQDVLKLQLFLTKLILPKKIYATLVKTKAYKSITKSKGFARKSNIGDRMQPVAPLIIIKQPCDN